VSSWIRRGGIIPAENVIELTELNGLKLIKALPYGETAKASQKEGA
jgi:hypothetical protein